MTTGLAGDCGVAQHDADCMCDVQVHEPTPINFAPTEVWHGQLILSLNEHLGYPWTGAKFADFYEALTFGYDCWRKHNEAGAEQHDNLLKFLRSGESIVDAPDALGLTWDQTLRLLLAEADHKSGLWHLTDIEWIGLEGMLRSNASSTAIKRYMMDKTGRTIGHPKLVELYEQYGVQRRETRTLTPLATEAKDRLLELVEGGRTVAASLQMLKAEGLQMSQSAAYKLANSTVLRPEKGGLVKSSA